VAGRAACRGTATCWGSVSRRRGSGGASGSGRGAVRRVVRGRPRATARSQNPSNDASDAIPRTFARLAAVCRSWCGCRSGSPIALAAARNAVRKVLTRSGWPLRMPAKTSSSTSLFRTGSASSATRDQGIGTSRHWCVFVLPRIPTAHRCAEVPGFSPANGYFRWRPRVSWLHRQWSGRNAVDGHSVLIRAFHLDCLSKHASLAVRAGGMRILRTRRADGHPHG